MINSDFLFNRILQNVGLDTLHNSLIKDKTDFVILVKPTESNHTELYGFANEELHEELPTSLPAIQTSEENITDIINELRVISKDLLETIETPFINTTEYVTTDGAAEAVNPSTTVPSNATDTPDTTFEWTTDAITSTTEDTKEHVTQASLISSNSTTESIPTTQRAGTDLENINQIYTTELMQTISSENSTGNAAESTTSQNNFETTFVPDYDVEGSVVVGEIIESIDETSGGGNLFEEPTIDVLPRLDFLNLKPSVITYVFKHF